MISIRLLDASDTKTFRQLRLKSFQDDPLAFSESYEDEVERSLKSFESELLPVGNPIESFVLGAFSEDDQLIGFVKFRRDLRTKARHKSMIHAMYTRPDYRGKGVGSDLINKLFEMTSALKGLEQIHLWVLHAQESAAGFYRKLGFESQGTKVIKDLKIGDTYVDAEYMVKYLI